MPGFWSPGIFRQNYSVKKLVSALPDPNYICEEKQIAGLVVSKLNTLAERPKHLRIILNLGPESVYEFTFRVPNDCLNIFLVKSKSKYAFTDELVIEFEASVEAIQEDLKQKLDYLDSLHIQTSEGLIKVDLPRRFKHKTLVLCQNWERPYFVDHTKGTDFVMAFLNKHIVDSFKPEDVVKQGFQEIIAMRRPELLRPFCSLDVQLSVYNTEQMSVQSLKQSLIAAIKALAPKRPIKMYDYSKFNLKEYSCLGLESVHLPVECPEKKQLALLVSKTPKTYDFAHVGQLTERRKKTIESLRHKGFSIHVIEHLWSIERDREIAKCSSLLNIHQSDAHKVFETCRCNRFIDIMPIYSEESEELPLKVKLIKDIVFFDLSILVPTMNSRQFVFNQLKTELERQIDEVSYKVQIIVDLDDGQKTIGQKRNDMLLKAKSQYCVFIDDDDIVSPEYLKSFEPMIADGSYDCSSFLGAYYLKNKFIKRIRHSLAITKWSETNEEYLRNTNHLNVLRTHIAKQIGFKNIRKGEDLDFSIRLAESKLLKKEFSNSTCLYYYVDFVKNIRNFCTYRPIRPFELIVDYRKPKILVKLPSRSRPHKLLDVLKKYIKFAGTDYNITYLISIDDDDASMTEPIKKQIRDLGPSVVLVSGISKSKIDACNRDMSEDIVNAHDILMLASDDMIPIKDSWASIVVQKFHDIWPAFDGVVHFNDGFTFDRLDTFCILGSAYYKQFNYFYYPEYKSLWCDNEFTLVAKQNKKYAYDSTVLFKHEHPANMRLKSDSLYDANEKYYESDKAIFDKRKTILKLY